MKGIVGLLGLCLLLSACGYQEGIVQRAEKSYLRFTGNVAKVSVQIDDAQPFILNTDATGASPANTLHQLSPGRHRIVVTRDGHRVVDRVVILDNQTTMEVQVP